MLEFDAGSPANSVKTGSEATFRSDVMEASRQNPVLAYFSASWCGPCKSFGPDLENAVRSARGTISLVKIDVDANQRLAAQLRIQSIPAVFPFVDGQPVDAFSEQDCVRACRVLRQAGG